MRKALQITHEMLSDVAEDSFIFLSGVPGRGYIWLALVVSVGYSVYKLVG